MRRLQEGQYVLQESSEKGRYWIPELELFLGIWFGERLGTISHWLRWWDEAVNLLLWSAEQAEQERLRAEQQRQEADVAKAELEAQRQRNE